MSGCAELYRPDLYNAGFHKIVVQADVAGAIVYSRPGYEVMELRGSYLSRRATRFKRPAAGC